MTQPWGRLERNDAAAASSRQQLSTTTPEPLPPRRFARRSTLQSVAATIYAALERARGSAARGVRVADHAYEAAERDAFGFIAKHMMPCVVAADADALVRAALAHAPGGGMVVVVGAPPLACVNAVARYAAPRRVYALTAEVAPLSETECTLHAPAKSWTRDPFGTDRLAANATRVSARQPHALDGFLATHAMPLDYVLLTTSTFHDTYGLLRVLAPHLRADSIVQFGHGIGFPGWREMAHRALVETLPVDSKRWRYFGIGGTSFAVQMRSA